MDGYAEALGLGSVTIAGDQNAIWSAGAFALVSAVLTAVDAFVLARVYAAPSKEAILRSHCLTKKSSERAAGLCQAQAGVRARKNETGAKRGDQRGLTTTRKASARHSRRKSYRFNAKEPIPSTS